MTVGILTGGFVGLLALGWWLAWKLGKLTAEVENTTNVTRLLWYTVNGFNNPYEEALQPERYPLPTKQ